MRQARTEGTARLLSIYHNGRAGSHQAGEPLQVSQKHFRAKPALRGFHGRFSFQWNAEDTAGAEKSGITVSNDVLNRSVTSRYA
jgi:hypothetical protein